MQTSARKNGLAIDSLAFDFVINATPVKDVAKPPKEGSFTYGNYLEGAKWDTPGACLAQPAPMELFAPMPIIHFMPVEGKKKPNLAKIYISPMYLYAHRTGSRERPSFVVAIELKTGGLVPEAWVKRGVALLLALSM